MFIELRIDVKSIQVLSRYLTRTIFVGKKGIKVKGTTLFLVKRSHLLYYHLKITSPKFKHPQTFLDLTMLKYNFWCWLFLNFLEMKAICFDFFPETVRNCLTRLANQNGNLLHFPVYWNLIWVMIGNLCSGYEPRGQVRRSRGHFLKDFRKRDYKIVV